MEKLIHRPVIRRGHWLDRYRPASMHFLELAKRQAPSACHETDQSGR